MRDKAQTVATNSLRSWGLFTFKPADPITAWKKKDEGGGEEGGGGRSTPPQEKGKADAFIWWDGRGAFVEVKNHASAFSFAQWAPHQRHWAAEISRVYKMDYWLWLEIGENDRDARDNPTRAWLVPASYMFWVETVLEPYQKSLPLVATRLVMREKRLDAPTLLTPFGLPWGKGAYILPTTHPFYLAYRPPLQDLRKTWIKFQDPKAPPKPEKEVTRSKRSSKSSSRPKGQQSLW